MKTTLCFTALFLCATMILQNCTTKESEVSRDYPITPVDFTHVKLKDGFWKEWVSTAVQKTIPFSFQKCEETGRIDNFIFAGGIRKGKFQGSYGFNDSDVYKIMEGAAYSLMLAEDPEMEAYLDTLVYYISEAQEDDGYLYTAWTLKANDYTDFQCCTYHEDGQWIGTSRLSHEFYNAGHMYEAAVAHYQATGKRTFLGVAIKNADLIYDVCINQGRRYVPGHQEIEIGLAKLYRVTGDERYIRLAKHLLDIRADVVDHEYNQAHLPVTEQREAVGHAVRANYMYSAMADVAALTGDSAYLYAIGKIWENVVGKKLSITGGVGASHQGEAYGPDYVLPNHPYNETCAANTLQHDGETPFNQGVNGRSPWFNCSCCPSNLSRFVPSVAGYAYATKGKNMYVNLFMNSEVIFQTSRGSLMLSQQSNYPWEGKIRLEIQNSKSIGATICIRIPGWAQNRPVPSDLFSFINEQEQNFSLQVNGKPIQTITENGYVSLPGRWKKGDVIELNLPMEARIIRANEKVDQKAGLRAVQYGPIVYCAEEVDNQVDVLEARIDNGTEFRSQYRQDLLGGINMLEGGGLRLIPYYAWANRDIGKMNVWLK
jgi:DUF1680 family protein